MANAWEYPGTNYEQGNYDYFITEVKEFNRKLDEYQEEVNQKLSDQDEEIASFKNLVNGQINNLRTELRDYEAELNRKFNNFVAEDAERFAHEMAAFNARLDTINNNIYEYLVTNLPSIIDDMPALQDAIILNQTEQVVFTEHAAGFDVDPTITCNKTADDIKSRIANHTFNPIIVGLDSRLHHTVTEYWVAGGEGQTLLYMTGYCCNRSGNTPGTIGINRNYKFLLTFHQVGDTLVQADIHYIDLPVFLRKGSYEVSVNNGIITAYTDIPVNRVINVTGACIIDNDGSKTYYGFSSMAFTKEDSPYNEYYTLAGNLIDTSVTGTLTIEYTY